MPICVAYAVFRLRVLDVNFVLNRALVYGVLSLGVIAFVSILDWFFSRVVSLGRLAVGLELLATIAIGFLLDRINRGVERFVEAVFFGRRIAERYIRRAASALPYATDESAKRDGLVQIPVDALDLAASALYRRSAGGARFEGVATARQTTIAPPGFSGNDLLVRMLLADESIVWLDELRSHLDPANAGIYTLAVPVTVRHELVSLRFTVHMPTVRNSTPMRWSYSRNSPAKPREPTITSRPSARASGIRSSSPKKLRIPREPLTSLASARAAGEDIVERGDDLVVAPARQAACRVLLAALAVVGEAP